MCGAFTLLKQQMHNQSDSAAHVSTENGYGKGKHVKLQTLVLVEDSFTRSKMMHGTSASTCG